MREFFGGFLVLTAPILFLLGLAILVRPPKWGWVKGRKTGFGVLLVSVLLAAVGSFLPQPPAPGPTAAATPAPKPPAASAAPGVRAQTEAVRPASDQADKAPTEAQMAAAIDAYERKPLHDAPELSLCAGTKLGDDNCRYTRYQFATQDWPRAWKGDIEALRNVAFCLTTTCDGAVVSNRVQACAWSMLIATSGSGLVEDGDADHFRLACHGLDDASAFTAASREVELRRQIRAFHEPAE